MRCCSAAVKDLAGGIEQVAVLGARLLLQAAIEAEVTAFLGRDRYQRAAGCDDARAGLSSGYCSTTATVGVEGVLGSLAQASTMC